MQFLKFWQTSWFDTSVINVYVIDSTNPKVWSKNFNNVLDAKLSNTVYCSDVYIKFLNFDQKIIFCVIFILSVSQKVLGRF